MRIALRLPCVGAWCLSLLVLSVARAQRKTRFNKVSKRVVKAIST